MGGDGRDPVSDCGNAISVMNLDIHKEFDELMERTLPGVPKSDIQYVERRRMFFSGVAAMYYHMVGSVADMPEDEAEAELRKIGAQLKDYFTRFLVEESRL